MNTGIQSKKSRLSAVLLAKVKQMMDELLELLLSIAISSRVLDHFAQDDGTMLGNVLSELRRYQNLMGLFKIIASLAAVVMLHIIRLSLSRAACWSPRAMRITVDEVISQKGWLVLYGLLIAYFVCSAVAGR